MSTNLLSHPAPSSPRFGVVTLDGVSYIERPQILVQDVTITSPTQIVENVPLTMPGHANFLLKGLTRDIVARDVLGQLRSLDVRFRFKLSGQQGSTWFFSGGLGIIDDRVVDTMCFGLAQFPYPIIPPIAVPANGSLFFDVEHITALTAPFHDRIPYTIYFAFHGSYLFPVQDASPASPYLTMGTTGVA